MRIFETPIDEARKLGAMMLFGEKYGDIVRVVEVAGYSLELCGGTHVALDAPRSGRSRSSPRARSASGARRIEAVTVGRGLRATSTQQRARRARASTASELRRLAQGAGATPVADDRIAFAADRAPKAA